jgi:PAP2 superfamily C-terminal
MLRTLLLSWREATRQPSFRVIAVSAVFFLVVVLVLYSSFLRYIDTRQGSILNDPLLRIVSPRDFSTITFLVIYGSLLGGIVSLVPSPRRLVVAILSYASMVVIRMGAMYVLPLDPPEGLIVLRDPLVEVFGPGTVLTRDLFFSGHTATLFILLLTARTTVLRLFFGAAMITVAVLLLWQHVHYTVDVLAAPFFTLPAYLVAHRIVGGTWRLGTGWRSEGSGVEYR